MAMNKLEKQMVEDLRVKCALRWTSPVEPDVPVPESCELSTGFLPCAARSDSARVDVACSDRVHHGVGTNTKTTSQGTRRLHSTRLLALRALRYEVEQYCAGLLRQVDAQIEAEESRDSSRYHHDEEVS